MDSGSAVIAKRKEGKEMKRNGDKMEEKGTERQEERERERADRTSWKRK